MTSPVITQAMCPPALLRPTGYSPEMRRRYVDSALGSWVAMADGMSSYWAGAIARGATPYQVSRDMQRWWRLMTDRRPPTWATPHEIAWSTPLARLRDFSAGADDGVVPTLVLPPQAGHDSCIVDYCEDQSQVQVIKAAGLSRLYSLDWVGATQQTKDASITDYLELIERAIDHIGGPVNLIGDCQGGWLATIYAALRPDQVNTHTIAGAPIDFHADNPVIGDWLDAIDAEGDMAFYEWAVAMGNGVLKGEFMLNGFVMIKPEQEVEKQMQLLSRLSDPQQLERYRVFEDWFKHTQDIPGAFYLWIVRHLFRGNELVGGTLAVGDEKVDLSRISCPLNLLAGGVDHITPPGQVFALAEAASTPKAKVTRRTTSGGHLGLFMGREALREHWPPLLAGVYEHSKPKASRARAEGRARAKTPAKRTKPAIPAP
ncbi:MAG: DUF3141 domain-containing protein [Thermoleophilaceae bacterium]|nr:DUF3141 domain-containing protein [Thermoleophilaceae bacterium]